ncbi:hypothetical protein SADUNF_Sadunf01G0090800 [Salix dunnii]|uniref:Phytocyanin domain-containing protein n=1 Tax=Salix dunnii TaxID=1413687 RepID=A0A835NAV3_9ROSI|nr:hypothetical protein SADUNF_Sadunf01G0090800 [Salix dunnii]
MGGTAVFVPSVLTTEHVVGDKTVWNPGFDYKTWAQGKAFYVGDTLVFKYTPGAHSVLTVNGTGFQERKAANDIVLLTTGNDKLSITVLPQLGSPETSPSSSPTSTTSSGAAGNIASRYYGLIVAIAGIFGMIMF